MARFIFSRVFPYGNLRLKRVLTKSWTAVDLSCKLRCDSEAEHRVQAQTCLQAIKEIVGLKSTISSKYFRYWKYYLMVR